MGRQESRGGAAASRRRTRKLARMCGSPQSLPGGGLLSLIARLSARLRGKRESHASAAGRSFALAKARFVTVASLRKLRPDNTAACSRIAAWLDVPDVGGPKPPAAEARSSCECVRFASCSPKSARMCVPFAAAPCGGWQISRRAARNASCRRRRAREIVCHSMA